MSSPLLATDNNQGEEERGSRDFIDFNWASDLKAPVSKIVENKIRKFCPAYTSGKKFDLPRSLVSEIVCLYRIT